LEARNRYVPDWFTRIRTGQVRLPRFQRLEAWSHAEVTSLLESVLRGLPAGAALVLEIGDREPFLSRTMPGAPHATERVNEHLLDGQQRLTALWRALHDLYDDRTYFAYVENTSGHDEDSVESKMILGVGRWTRDGKKFPLWADDPREHYARGLIPFHLLRPGDPAPQVREWCDEATDGDLIASRDLQDRVNDLRGMVALFNIPFLSLPVHTPPDVAVRVFVKLNTTAVELTPFDILVAQGEAATGQSLRDLESELRRRVPALSEYVDPGDLILSVAAYREDRSPTEASFFRLDLRSIFEKWDDIAAGIAGAISFLEEEAVFDRQRLPTMAVVPVISALWGMMPKSLDGHGYARSLIRKYLWRSFLTRRYENAAATRGLQDFRGLRSLLLNETERLPIPLFDEEIYPAPTTEELMRAPWPRGRDILARGLLAVSLRGGAFDFADDRPASRDSVKKREYHHLFPDSLLEQDGLLSDQERFRALNCALVTWTTNRNISNKEPIKYLLERTDKAALGEPEIRRRLETHAVPFDALNVGGYAAELNQEAREAMVKRDYQAFLEQRSQTMQKAITLLWNGERLAP
jgi:hypothetical protein